MVPVISSLCQGPLGVCQLPRFWWKALLHSTGKLDPEYPACSRELDAWCLQVLEIPQDAALAFISQEKPTYPGFEAWVLEQRGTPPNPKRVRRWNQAVYLRQHVNPAKIEETYRDIGYSLQEEAQTSALLLNSMQDWALHYHRNLGNNHNPGAAVMPPLISSLDQGPLGVMQLPRTWLKILMAEHGRLNPDYPACGGGLDAQVLKVLGLDQDRTLEFLRRERPSYLAFESWVRVEIEDDLDRNAIGEFHQRLTQRIHPDGKRAQILERVGLAESEQLRHGVILNHLEDWAYAHSALLS